jgi:hypothetical protein
VMPLGSCMSLRSIAEVDDWPAIPKAQDPAG